ncbi:uncharacterized protein LOC128162475 [Crassostrea angulata]|uniref:uncharacterized protein LOC128162475 n=1 Tax=Magallana angulata TaxID=2784310 RepID=UPI0022B0F0C7|nr:uncharacterized protein LOC128162475 [Crassostrea angulata]
MMEDMTTIVLPLLIMYTYMNAEVLALTSCEESAMTVRIVTRCPSDLSSWENAAKSMKCESIDNNCLHTIRSKGDHRFQYHCVINTWMNATFEVCAPNRIIFGYCTEYNVMGRVIQENYDANCTTHDPPCPAIYNSTDAYKYKTCYDLVRKNRQKKENMDKDSQNPDFISNSERCV